MAIRWDGDSNSNKVNVRAVDGSPSNLAGSVSYLGNRVTLKDWNFADPPNSLKVLRNDKICSWYQGNRNPFVDNHNLVNTWYNYFDDSHSVNLRHPSGLRKSWTFI